jgi:hypothetical protein
MKRMYFRAGDGFYPAPRYWRRNAVKPGRAAIWQDSRRARKIHARLDRIVAKYGVGAA